ncbi:MAG: TonB-dependent receptor [Acidobacteria bacterium]|nr:TonB-dependent receptor [Acidobacteriota bacterium]
MKIMRPFVPYLALCMLIVLVGSPIFASASATITGRVTDQQELVVPGAQVRATNILTNIHYAGETNDDGFYRIPNLPPGEYRVIVQKDGFASIAKPGVELHVQDTITLNFAMQVGSVTQTVTVEAGAPLLNTESAAVSTVVNRQFAENIPLNGRSFQTLFQLTPGVILTRANTAEQGQFSANGQRANANYFTIDGVGANVGAAPSFTPGQSLGGATPGFGVTGGTNNLVSVDAMQEFRIQTSSFAAEFGRTPGAQISVETRSGTNEFHGTLFEYFRNDVLDANDWFANQQGLRKPKLRQNDFGGVLGGPILRDRTFFFFSYEGLRLRQPLFQTTTVPSMFARQNAPVALQPLLNAFPLPNGPDTVNPTTGLPTGFAPFSAGYSNPSSLNATSLRVDHRPSSKVALFGRYNYAPSSTIQRGTLGSALSNLNPVEFKTQTLTVGATFAGSSRVSSDLRFNYSRNDATQSLTLDSFGGAVKPQDSALFPSFAAIPEFGFTIIGGASFIAGSVVESLQRQVNLVDTSSFVVRSHHLKFGIDYRRLFPVITARDYLQSPLFTGIGITAPGVPPPAGTVFSGTAFRVGVTASAGPLFPVFNNFSTFAQDTWRVGPRLTLTYGLRWELNPAPSESNGNDPLTVAGLDDPSTATLAPPGTKLYDTSYSNFAPRVGVAYELSQRHGREMVLRGGFGIFYDLGNGQAANVFVGFPFSASKTLSLAPYPLTPAQEAPPSLDPNRLATSMTVFVPDLDLPRSYQWNLAVEQSLGSNQSISASYVAAVGRRLLRQERLAGTAFRGTLNPGVFAPTAFVQVTRNTATSDYHSLQLQFQRRLSRGLQALASYTWSHSIDIASADSAGDLLPAAAISPQLDRGPSDFDVRHAFSGTLTYDVPTPRLGGVGRSLLGNWSIDTFLVARSATPVNVTYIAFLGSGLATLRPDLVTGEPLFLNDPTVGGGRRINPAAFSIPSPPRQGTLGRNALRGFRASQLDFALRRQFNFTERFRLQFRTEFFNILNHPNFGDPVGIIPAVTLFGKSRTMLAQSLGLGGASGGFNPLYQIGGPRSIQFALKLQF